MPRGENGEFIARPRALAISKFAPQNIVYHEGAKWEVPQFASPPGGLRERKSQKRICLECGAFADTFYDRCPVCNVLFDGANSEILSLLEMPNVRLRRRERITCNEEERIRRGYQIQVSYAFPPGGSGVRLQEADFLVREQPVLQLVYAPATTIAYINRGWRTHMEGFLVDVTGGELLSDSSEDRASAAGRSGAAATQSQNLERLKLWVREYRNAPVLTYSRF